MVQYIAIILYAFLFTKPIPDVGMIPEEKIREMVVEGNSVRTTFSPGSRFIGRYTGKKSGYLLLNADGTGEYCYDVFGIAPSHCKPGVILFEWGFLVDQENKLIRNKRDYGYSYPVLFISTSQISFQGCSKRVFVDYILEYSNGDLHVSSSDDWVKEGGRADG